VISAGEEEHEGEEDRDDPGASIDLLDLAGEDLDEDVGDEAEGDTVGDVVGQRHERDGHEAGNRSGGIVPVDGADIRHHENADIDQSRSAGVGRDELCDRRKEHRDEEQSSSRHGGKTGAAALGNAGRGLDERGDGGGTGASGGIASDSYLKDPDCNPSQTTNVGGADIVAYAQQFVGNPYVWGGNSLTNGVDCSGFVHQVYAHFGISTPRYSQAFKSVGQPVSYQNIQAGDVVVYPGHVAIYIGNGNIVEAQSTRAGITNSRPVNCHTITAIRRLV